MKRLARYLKGPEHLKLKLLATGKPKLVGLTDADWAESTRDHKSTSGYVFLYESWAIMSTEAEYVAFAEVWREVLWLSSHCYRDVWTQFRCDLGQLWKGGGGSPQAGSPKMAKAMNPRGLSMAHWQATLKFKNNLLFAYRELPVNTSNLLQDWEKPEGSRA